MAASEAVTGSVEAVGFSFLTDAEVRRHSVIKITNPNLLDLVEQPIAGGLYDPALGSLDERTRCKTCGQRSFNCPGHCGHIDLVSPIYNPLMFNTLYNILKRMCLYCYHFKQGSIEVKKCVSQLELILKGDVARAKDLDSDKLKETFDLEDQGHHGSKDHGAKSSKQQKLTSLQLTEALSILNKFLKLDLSKCRNCEAKRLKVTKPVFGWLQMERISGARARANVLRNSKLEGPFSDGESLPEEEIINDATPSNSDADTDCQATTTKNHRRRGDKVPHEYIEQIETFSGGPMLPSDVKKMVRLLWENETELCSYITDIQHQGFGNKADYSMFFLETILVPPIKFRPPSKGGDSVMEHPHTVLLVKVLQANIELGNAHVNNLEYTNIVRRWMDLQQSVNVMFDSKTATSQRNVAPGICQLLEKKEGIFRQKMMGKRVNFACRSVISPDPYLAVNEIGIPPYFALRLTYPERVTPWNVAKLRDAIINGPEIHPGATHYVDKLSTVKLPTSRKSLISLSRKLPSSRGVVMQNGKNLDYESEGKIVLRHLQDGDIVLVNRQPTLHKPSIMAHVVRVLKGEKTIRMHYANCSTYNADFDGDEMNVHLPQDEISRAEGYNILNANNQYVKPTSGEPIRALIQDHIVSAVVLTKKDTFLRWDEFNHLLYSTGLSNPGSGASSRKFGNKVVVSDFEAELKSLMPAIWKPEPLWTGKQVITALLNHITRGFQPFTVEKGGKIPRDFFKSTTVEVGKDGQDEEKKPSRRRKAEQTEPKRQKEPIKERKINKDELKMKEDLDEDKLFIYKNNFVRGVIDKAQFGDYGLVHTVHELYGSNTAGLLLSSLSRLFTVYLQMHGFTCGVDDLLIVKSKDRERHRVLEKCEDIGEEVHREFVGVKQDENIDPFTLQLKIEKTVRINGEAALASLDRKMISQVNDITSKSEELKGLLSKGLVKPPSKNCISLMTTSGAKGGAVNFQQISSHLGQQELEGKRVPRMASGKTLPCFPAWDWTARAGGLVIDRFLSGLRPQEFYFHCMAGREGLVDTAVKTSRSGYLQRCLIKNLECLKNKQMIYKECCREIDKSSSYIKELPSALEKKAMKFVNKLSAEGNLNGSSQGDFLKLMEHKYLSSLAQPGEPVGVLAAQSVGEPSTQMTLNTFHLAGRGEMNVTLGIPRLQEILMTAAVDIKTPVMTCPLQEGRSEEKAKNLAYKLKKISVADVIETMTVTVEPFSLKNNRICRIYKLEMKLYRPGPYQEHGSISSEECEDILGVDYVRALEDAIKYHLKLLGKINGIQNFSADTQSITPNEGDEDFSSSRAEHDEEDDDVGDGENEGQEDLGLDAEKRRRQSTDEVDYEDDLDEEVNEETRAGSESEEEKGDDEVEFSKDKEGEMLDAIGGLPESPSKAGILSNSESPKTKTKSRVKSKKKIRRQFIGKDEDHSIFVEAKGFNLKVHFKFTPNEPHILLAQIAQKAATKVYIQSSGKIENCQQISCKENQVIYYGKDPKRRVDIPLKEKEKIPALQTSGVDFMTFWKLQDILDVRYIYTNDIHAMLSTYGVEAARETIIREITNVFKSYGISVNIRHLTLIADFMTHTGGYRPMSRHGGIADSISPFSKMSFETASKFIVEAAYHREMDDLETPSARICLGLPVKVGTGCFDLMQKIEV